MTNLDALKSSLLAQSKTLVPQWLPSGKPNGHEWVALNPTRPDRSLGSFSVNLRTGQWAEMNPQYADKGTNLVSLYAYINGMEFEDAVKALESGNPNLIPSQSQPTPAPKIIEPKVPLVMPVPADAPPAPEFHYQLGKASIRYVYKDVKGNLCGYVERWNYDKPVNGRLKDFRPLFYSKKSGWVYNAPSPKKPIYGAEKLAQHPHARVVVVEGEKACDAAQRLLPDWVCLSWLGGSNTAAVADWGIVKKREVYLWPDNDEAGANAMGAIQAALNKTNKRVVIVDFQTTKDKWDLADAEDDEWTTKDVLTVIDTEVMPDEIGEAVSVASNPWFECLGFSNEPADACWYFSKRTNSLRHFTPSSLDQRTLLAMGESDDNWERMTGVAATDTRKGGVNTAFTALYNDCIKKGVFFDDMKRGVGAWKDTESPNGYVFHAGSCVFAGDTTIPFGITKSRHVYCQEATVPFGEEPLPLDATSKLMEILSLVSWEKRLNAMLLAGWLFIAPVAGVLDWRPHIYIYGPAGSGKTTMMGYIEDWMGKNDFLVSGTSKSTEPGIRGEIGQSTKPVIIDEFENYDDKQRLNSILNLITGSSSGRSNAGVLKGTKNGGVKRYTTRSIFCLASITPSLTESAHRQRFTLLGMVASNDPNRKKNFERQLDLKHELDTQYPSLSAQLRRRSFDYLPQLQETIKAFKIEFDKKGYGRLSDQLSPLMAGYWMMTHNESASEAQAAFLVSQIDFSENEETEGVNEWENLLELLAGTREKIQNQSTLEEITIGEMVARVAESNYSKEAAKFLNRRGIRVEGGRVLIANNHTFLKTVWRDTLGNANWHKILNNVPDSKQISQKSFGNKEGKGNTTQRSVSIPIETLLRFSREAGLIDEPNPHEVKYFNTPPNTYAQPYTPEPAPF